MKYELFCENEEGFDPLNEMIWREDLQEFASRSRKIPR